MNTSYLFYDCETSGLSPCFDQVLQFAAIRTDMQFNELERHSFYIQLSPDTIPHPQAVLTHQIGFEAYQEGLTEYEGIQTIHALLNTPGTISVGYNTLGFDDEFLRFAFFRHLLTPYTHQYANGCSRMDIYPLTVAYRLFNPSAIQWPDGEPVSLKLENIAKANGWDDGPAHDALNDVVMTIKLAKQLAQAAPETWDYLLQYFDKQAALSRLDAMQQQDQEATLALLMNGRFGHKNNYLSPAVYLGPHRVYRNQQCWLRLDSPTLDDAWTMMTKPGEPPFVLPTKERFLAKLNPEKHQLMEDNWNQLQKQPDLLIAIRDDACAFQYPAVDHLDAYAALYDHGFWTREESDWCQHFHTLSWSGKAHAIERIHNPLLKQLAIRLVGKYTPDALDDADQESFQHYLHERWHPTGPHNDHRGKNRFTPDDAKQCISESVPMNKRGQALLNALKKYIEHASMMPAA